MQYILTQFIFPLQKVFLVPQFLGFSFLYFNWLHPLSILFLHLIVVVRIFV
uniref:Uncharacterized protein n=1 Tax=Anguilla anguilla TaxID=7936 RepID=A0A0E9UL84_ANGAN